MGLIIKGTIPRAPPFSLWWWLLLLGRGHTLQKKSFAVVPLTPCIPQHRHLATGRDQKEHVFRFCFFCSSLFLRIRNMTKHSIVIKHISTYWLEFMANITCRLIFNIQKHSAILWMSQSTSSNEENSLVLGSIGDYTPEIRIPIQQPAK